MEFKTILFYAFSLTLILSGLRVITARNPVYAALSLVLAFFSAAGIWMLMKAEFLSIVLVLVYVGAVMVLFLFVVMMLDVNLEKLREGFWSYFPLAAVIGILMVAEISYVLIGSFGGNIEVPEASDHIGNTKALGLAIFTDYVFAFEVAAVILLLAIVSAVALTVRRRKDTKQIDPALAVRVKASDRIRVVKMQAEKSDSMNTGAEPGLREPGALVGTATVTSAQPK